MLGSFTDFACGVIVTLVPVKLPDMYKGIKLADEHFKGTLQSYVKIVLRNEFLEVRANDFFVLVNMLRMNPMLLYFTYRL